MKNGKFLSSSKFQVPVPSNIRKREKKEGKRNVYITIIPFRKRNITFY
jgi:hypothetical protein